MNPTQAIEFMSALTFLMIGLSYMLRSKDWIIWMENFYKNSPQSSLVLGSSNVFIGSLILGFHWVWQGLPVIISVIAVVIIIKGMLNLLLPARTLSKMAQVYIKHELWLRMIGIVLVILSVLLFNHWYNDFVCNEENLLENADSIFNSDFCTNLYPRIL